MHSESDLDRFWDTAAAVLLWCFVFSLATLLFWFAIISLCGDLVYSWHSWFTPIARDQFNAVHYAGMALLKLVAFVLFLFPYLGIKLVQRKRGQ